MKNQIIVVLLMLCLIVPMQTVSAQDSLNIALVNKTEVTWDAVSDIITYGDYAIVAANYSGLIILDISDINAPQTVQTLEGRYSCLNIYNETFLFTVEQQSYELKIYDISSPESPELFDSIELQGYHEVFIDIRFYDEYVFIREIYGNNYQIYSLQDMVNIEYVTNVNLERFKYENDLLYTIDEEYGLIIYDALDFNNLEEISRLELPGAIRDLYVNGDYTYVFSYVTPHPDPLFIVDTSTPEEPALIHTLNGVGTTGYIHASEELDENRFITSHYNGIDVYNISDPLFPELEGTYDENYGSFRVSDNRLAFAGYEGGWIVDFTDPSAPQLLGQIGDTSDLRGLAVYQNCAYLNTFNGVYIYDISDINNPELVNRLTEMNLSQFQVVDSYAYALESNHLKIYSLADPQAPEETISYRPHNGTISLMAIDGNYAYLGGNRQNNDCGVYVIDLSDMENPVFLYTYTMSGAMTNMSMALGYLTLFTTVGQDNRILQIIDTKNPDHITRPAHTDVLHLGNNLTSSGHNIYVHDGDDSELQVFDARGQRLISPENTFITEGMESLSDMSFYGSYLFMSNRYSYGLQSDITVYDMSSTTNLEVSAHYHNTVYNFYDLEITPDEILAIDYNNFYMLDYDLNPVPSDFALLAPGEGQDVQLSEASSIEFSWENSTLPDQLPGPFYKLSVRVVVEDQLDTIRYWENLADTNHTLNLIEEFNLAAYEENVRVVWWVQAIGNDHMIDCESVARFTLLQNSNVDEDANSEVIQKFGITDIYPNPFNSFVNIKFNVQGKNDVMLSLFDLLGREVKRLEYGQLAPAQYQVSLNSTDLASGVYFVRLSSGAETGEMKKVVLIK